MLVGWSLRVGIENTDLQNFLIVFSALFLLRRIGRWCDYLKMCNLMRLCRSNPYPCVFRRYDRIEDLKS